MLIILARIMQPMYKFRNDCLVCDTVGKFLLDGQVAQYKCGHLPRVNSTSYSGVRLACAINVPCAQTPAYAAQPRRNGSTKTCLNNVTATTQQTTYLTTAPSPAKQKSYPAGQPNIPAQRQQNVHCPCARKQWSANTHTYSCQVQSNIANRSHTNAANHYTRSNKKLQRNTNNKSSMHRVQTNIAKDSHTILLTTIEHPRKSHTNPTRN